MRYVLPLWCALAFPVLAGDGVPKLADIAWMEGQWVGEKEGGVIEEHWSKATENSMIGMFRLFYDEQAQLYEFMAIEQTDMGLTLYLRHFGQKLMAKEERDKPMVFFATPEPPPARSVVFDRIDKPETRTKLYYRMEGKKLAVTLDRLINGKRNIEAFEFDRAPGTRTR